jgi:hypothetical protein
MSGSGIGIDGVALPTVSPNAKDFGSPGGSLCSETRIIVNELGLSGVSVKLDRHRFAMEGSPGLNVGSIDRHRGAHQMLSGDGRSSRLVGEPGGVDPRFS